LPDGIGAKAKAVALTAAQRAALLQAGDALADWLRRMRLDAQALRAGLDAGTITLTAALAGVQERDVAPFRARFRGLVEGIAPERYVLVLQQLATHPDMREQAKLLYESRYYHRHFLPAMQRIRSWFLHGGPLA